MRTEVLTFGGLLAVAQSAILGCGALLTSVDPAALPPEIELVISNEETFRQSDDHPLANVDAGEFIDELADGLSGCWGAAEVFQNDGSEPIPIREVKEHEVYRMDASTGEFEWQLHQVAAFPLIGERAFFLSRHGTFSIADSTSISVIITSSTFSDPDTGQLRTKPKDNPSPSVRLVTIDGPHMKIRFATEEPSPTHDRQDLVFKRFDCPDAE